MKDENPELRKVARALRGFVKRIVPSRKETVNAWGVPTFEAPDPFCFYMLGKNHVTFGLHFATSLRDPQGLLEGTGKNVRHVKLQTVAEHLSWVFSVSSTRRPAPAPEGPSAAARTLP